MRRFAFVIFILGMIILVGFFIRDPREIGLGEDLLELEDQTRVVVSGRVVEERVIYEGTKLIGLDNGIELICECLGRFMDKEVEVIGSVEEYKEKKQIRVERIEIR